MAGNRYICGLMGHSPERGAQGIDHRLPLVVLVIFMRFDSFLDIDHSECSGRGGGVIERQQLRNQNKVSSKQ